MNDGLSKKLKPRHAGSLSTAIALLLAVMAALMVIIAIVALVVPRFISSIIGIFNSLKDGMSKVADWFEAPVEANELTANLNEMIKLEEDNGK